MQVQENSNDKFSSIDQQTTLNMKHCSMDDLKEQKFSF